MAATLRAFLLLLPLAGLAACDRSAEEASPAGKRAEGEVLGGTISDDMIALDRLRSQSPPLRPSSGENAGSVASAGEAAASEGGNEPAGEPVAAPDPASPEPE